MEATERCKIAHILSSAFLIYISPVCSNQFLTRPYDKRTRNTSYRSRQLNPNLWQRIGRFGSVVLAHSFKNRAVLFTFLGMVVLGGCCIGMAYSYVYWHFVVCCGSYGLFSGSIPVLLPLSLVEMFGIASLKDSYAVIMFFCGISTRFGLPLVGWIEVEWGSYSLAFLITGAIYFVGGLHCVYCLLHVYIKEKLFKSENVE